MRIFQKNTNNEVKGSKKNIKKKRKNKFKKKWNSEYIWEFWRIPREGIHEKFEETLNLWGSIVLCSN